MAFLTELERKLDLPSREKKQVMREMASHYEDLVTELMASGMDASAAEQEAGRRLGDPRDVACRLGTIHCRASWKTAILMVVPFFLALVVHWHLYLVARAGLRPYHFSKIGIALPLDPGYTAAQIGSLIVLIILGALTGVACLREMRQGGRPMWLAVWAGVGLWSLMSIPLLTAYLPRTVFTQLHAVRSVATLETLALAIIAVRMSSRRRVLLGAVALLATVAVARLPWDPSGMVAVMLAQAPFIMVIARKQFGGQPYGNSAQVSLFLFAYYASNLSYMILKAPTPVEIVPLIMTIPVIVALLFYAKASIWAAKVVGLSVGIEIVGMLSGQWREIPMAHYAGHPPNVPGVEMIFLLLWVILVPTLLGRGQFPPAPAQKESRRVRLRRFGVSLLYTVIILMLMDLIGGMVMDRAFFHNSMLTGTEPGIANRPSAANYSFIGERASQAYRRDGILPTDLRSADFSALDISSSETELVHADFDSKTRWPAAVKSMKSFKPDEFMELGKNPGLGLRALHKQGVTGKGVGVAIIDYPLLVDHAEVKGRVRMYEEIHCADTQAAMHGCATSSIAVGKNVGVAPGADLYFIAVGNFRQSPLTMALCNVPYLSLASIDYGPDTRAIDRIVEINKHLPKDRKIRVISISQGYMGPRGWRAFRRAIERAERDGIFVVTCALEDTSGGKMRFNGLGREPMMNPDNSSSYGPGGWLAENYFSGGRRTQGDTLWVPMDSRCTASPTGNNDYAFYQSGGWSWCCPWLAGLYALACQVKPDVTPSEFWSAAMDTGDTVQVERDGKKRPLEKIVNPTRLIARLKSGN